MTDIETAIPIDDKKGVEDKYSTSEGVKLLHELLSEVDPKMAEYFHSNDRRKIVNAVFKYFRRCVIQAQQNEYTNKKEA